MQCDAGFFKRVTKQILTCWLAFTEVTFEKGPLFLIKGSHKFKHVQDKYIDFDVDIHKNKKTIIDTHHPICRREKYKKSYSRI